VYSSNMEKYNATLDHAYGALINITKMYEGILNENESMHNRIRDYTHEIDVLQQKIKMMEEDRQEFAKVSHIIALEKDNAKLRAEIAKLNIKRAPALVQQPLPVPQPPTEPLPPVPQAPVLESEEDVKEKKIKGVIYYVGLQSNKIFTKSDDGDVGNEVGHIKKEGSKSVVVWNTVVMP
jgi:hypothetical protein